MKQADLQILSILGEVVEHRSPEERAAYLDQACAGDTERRARVEALLRAYEAAGHFMQGDPAFPPQGRTIDDPLTERPGTVIGAYKLQEQIGEGGMGLVFVADQEKPIRRRVALKVIKPGMDSRQVIARFETERQALALMDHPNIAHVLDAGTTESGQPYFVMELVKGVPITEYCDQHRLTTRQRLELFLAVCSAVRHAHQKGIIHRDLKPSNVLVTVHDVTPVVKIIDFGIAKAIGQPLTDRSVYTGFSQLIGTPLYMSPEQSGLSSVDVDTRSDIYSLGVLLYELLTGTTPLDAETVKKASLDEMRRIIREDDPARPSARLSTLDARVLAAVAERRGADPRTLGREVRGELDWIVMKCLEKDRNRRYESAAALARDVERYQAGETVEACPPSTAYRLRKFLRKYRLVVSLAAAGLGVLLLAVAGLAANNQLLRAERARTDTARRDEEVARVAEREANSRARRRLEQVEKGNEILTRIFADLNPNPEEDAEKSLRILLTERVIEAARELDGESAGDAVRVALMQAKLGKSLAYLGRPEEAQALLDKAHRTLTEKLGGSHTETLVVKNNLALAYFYQGKYAATEVLFREALAGLTANLGPDHPNTLTTKGNLAETYHCLGEYARQEPLLNEVIAAKTASLGADHPSTLSSKHNLAVLYFAQGKYAEADALLHALIAAEADRVGASHIRMLTRKKLLAAVCREQRKHAQAEALLREVLQDSPTNLGADHPLTLGARTELARVYLTQGKTAEAESLLSAALPAQTARLGADHPSTLTTRRVLALVYQARGEHTRAEASFRDVIAAQAARRGPDHPETLLTKGELAFLLYVRRDYAGSEALYREVVTGLTARQGAEHPVTVSDKRNLAALYVNRGRITEAEPLLGEVLAARTARLGYDHRDSVESALLLHQVGVKLWEARELPAAERAFRGALAFYRRRVEELPASSPVREATRQQTGWTNFHLAVLLHDTGRPAEAKAEYERTLLLAPGNQSYPPNFWPRIALARLLATCPEERLRDPTRALELARIVVQQKDQEAHAWSTLGMALYRTGDWQDAIDALEKAVALRKTNDPIDWLFLAAAYGHRGDADAARRWYDRAVQWVDHVGPVVEHRALIGGAFVAPAGPLHVLTALRGAASTRPGVIKGGGDELRVVRAEAAAVLGVRAAPPQPVVGAPQP
jgi:serine/threonine protein kinase/Tfp pilus assembly protein PilF